MVSLVPQQRAHVGWWAVPEVVSPLAALRGSLLRAEMAARVQGFFPVLVYGDQPWRDSPGFTGEPVAGFSADDLAAEGPGRLDVLVVSGSAGPGGQKLAHTLGESGTAVVGVAPEVDWGLGPERANIGPPFAVPEPTLLAARHLPPSVLEARSAYLRVVEGLPRHYILVEPSLLAEDEWLGEPALERALARLAERASAQGTPAEVVALAPGPLVADDVDVNRVLRHRRAEREEGRHLAEEWPGDPNRPRLPLRVASPVDLAAAVAGAAAVVAESGALMALAWALGTPHVALATEDSPASDFAAWTGDASALVERPTDLLAAMDNIFARRGRPRGLRRLEATLDQSLDQAAAELDQAASPFVGQPDGPPAGPAALARMQELAEANEALRQRLAAERLRFGERSALLERAADTSVESAIKAVRGQDVILRRRLEQTEREMRRLQEETALQQAELRAIYATKTMKALVPARQWYGRLRKVTR